MSILEEVGQRPLEVFKSWLDKVMVRLLFRTVLGEMGAETLEFPSANNSVTVLVCAYTAEVPTSNLFRWDFHCRCIFFVGELFQWDFNDFVLGP